MGPSSEVVSRVECVFAYGWPASGDAGGARATFFDELRVLQFHSLHWIGGGHLIYLWVYLLTVVATI